MIYNKYIKENKFNLGFEQTSYTCKEKRPKKHNCHKHKQIYTHNNIPISDFAEIAENLKNYNYNFEGKTVLLLGGSGFLGTMAKLYFLYLNDYILTDKCKIVSIDNYIGREKPKEIEDPNLFHLEFDLTRSVYFQLKNNGISKIDFILNFTGNASPSGPSGYEKNPVETMDISYIGTKHVLEMATLEEASLLNCSSSEVLGTPDEKDIPTSEEVVPKIHTMNKRSPYDVFKAGLETLSWVYKTKYGTNVKVVRLFNCVGYFNQKDGRVIPNFISKAIKGEKLPLFAPGTQTRTFSFFTDVLTGIILVLLNGKDFLYHIGNPNNEISMLDLAKLVEKTSGKTNLVEIVPTPEVFLHEPKRRCPSIEKAKREIGFEPKVDLEEMLRRIYTWAEKTYD